MVQIWSGMIARTAPDWSLLIRPLANLPAGGGYALFEGIVESDRWFGPLFTNLRLTRTDRPVRFQADYPLAQVQPLPRWLYQDATLQATRFIGELVALAPADWEDYCATVVRPNHDPNRQVGRYAIAARRRRRGASDAAAPAAEGAGLGDASAAAPGQFVAACPLSEARR
jgi:uncharacterized protein DUF6065